MPDSVDLQLVAAGDLRGGAYTLRGPLLIQRAKSCIQLQVPDLREVFYDAELKVLLRRRVCRHV